MLERLLYSLKTCFIELKSNHDNNIGLTQRDNGDLIIISVPPLTEDSRRPCKTSKAEAEDAKMRNARKDANTEIKKIRKEELQSDICKDAEEGVQNLLTAY
jgi:ribosome recycling factor